MPTRRTYHMLDEMRDAVIRAALRYDVTVQLGAHQPHRGFTLGPRSAGLSFAANTLYLPVDAGPEDMLHELTHLVVGRPSLRMSEGFVLMPFEWELAKDIASEMRVRSRRHFMGAIQAYQDNTTVGRFYYDLSDYEHARSSRWWRRGIERAVRLRLLTSVENPVPTYLRAHWEGSGVPTRAKHWTPEYDDRYP